VLKRAATVPTIALQAVTDISSGISFSKRHADLFMLSNETFALV
jgi:hypothetical protein